MNIKLSCYNYFVLTSYPAFAKAHGLKKSNVLMKNTPSTLTIAMPLQFLCGKLMENSPMYVKPTNEKKYTIHLKSHLLKTQDQRHLPQPPPLGPLPIATRSPSCLTSMTLPGHRGVGTHPFICTFNFFGLIFICNLFFLARSTT
jgi:hypothetical protein